MPVETLGQAAFVVEKERLYGGKYFESDTIFEQDTHCISWENE